MVKLNKPVNEAEGFLADGEYTVFHRTGSGEWIQDFTFDSLDKALREAERESRNNRLSKVVNRKGNIVAKYKDMIKQSTKEAELSLDIKEPCVILNLRVDDLSITPKGMLIAHSGGMQVKEEKAIRTIACGKGFDAVGRIMFVTNLSKPTLKDYLNDNPKAELELSYKTNASISRDSKGNYNIEDIENGKAKLYVWRDNDKELPLIIRGIYTSH